MCSRVDWYIPFARKWLIWKIITLTLTLALTLKKEKEKIFDSDLFLIILWSVRWCVMQVWKYQRRLWQFFLDNIFFWRWQAIAKHVFVGIILGLFRSVWCYIEIFDTQRYILWPGLFVQNCLVYVTRIPELDTLTDRLAQKSLCVWNCKSLLKCMIIIRRGFQFIWLYIVVWV